MSFGNPQALLLIPIMLIISFIAYWHSDLLQKRLGNWIHPRFWSTVIPEFSRTTFLKKHVFLGMGILLLAFASARPQWGEREETIESRGMDILFLLDLSNSMLAEDTPPSRLGRARTFIREVLNNLGDDRAGIVSFAGKAFLTVPLTNDFDYVTEIAETLEPSSMASQGTQIGEAMDVAMRAFERSAEDHRKQSRAVILISDGEDFGESATAAAKKIREFGAGFFALSVGSPEGAPIPLRDEQGVLQTYKKDASQKPIISRVNRPLLAKIAEAGGGAHLELINPSDAAYGVTKALGNLARDEQRERREIVKIDRFQIFVALAILFLTLHLFTGYRSIRIKRSLVLLLFFHSASFAGDLSSFIDSSRGQKQYQSGQFEDSAKSYEKASEEDPENLTLRFNQGTALARAQNKEDAALKLQEATKKALTMGDFETAAKSLYNEGVLHQQSESLRDSFDRLTKAIELAKRSGLKELEEKARKALMLSFDKQQSKPKESKSQPKDNKQGEGNSGDPKPNSPEDAGGKQRQFRGNTVSKDVAESLMRDLADREKQLIQRRLGNKKGRENPNEKDW